MLQSRTRTRTYWQVKQLETSNASMRQLLVKRCSLSFLFMIALSLAGQAWCTLLESMLLHLLGKVGQLLTSLLSHCGPSEKQFTTLKLQIHWSGNKCHFHYYCVPSCLPYNWWLLKKPVRADLISVSLTGGPYWLLVVSETWSALVSLRRFDFEME